MDGFEKKRGMFFIRAFGIYGFEEFGILSRY